MTTLTLKQLQVLIAARTDSGVDEEPDQAQSEESHEEYLTRALDDFVTAIQVAGGSKGVNGANRLSGVALRAIEDLGAAMNTKRSNIFVNSDENKRLIQMVHQEILSGGVVIDNDEDILSLAFVIASGVYERCVDVIEHFISTGEIMEALMVARKDFAQAEAYRPAPFAVRAWHFQRSDDAAREKLFMTYTFDKEHQKEGDESVGSEGDDEESVMSLPLDIRMGFAGCFDLPAPGLPDRTPRGASAQ